MLVIAGGGGPWGRGVAYQIKITGGPKDFPVPVGPDCLLPGLKNNNKRPAGKMKPG